MNVDLCCFALVLNLECAVFVLIWTLCAVLCILDIVSIILYLVRIIYLYSFASYFLAFANFYVLYMEDDASLNPSPILLGRSFLKTSKTKIDVDKGKLTMEFDGVITEFDVFKETQNPIENQSISTVNMINFFDVQELSELKENSNSKFVEGRSSTNNVEFK